MQDAEAVLRYLHLALSRSKVAMRGCLGELQFHQLSNGRLYVLHRDAEVGRDEGELKGELLVGERLSMKKVAQMLKNTELQLHVVLFTHTADFQKFLEG